MTTPLTTLTSDSSSIIDLTKPNAHLVDVLSGFTVHVNNTSHSLTADELAALTTDVRFAANDWLSHFDNKGVIDIEVNIADIEAKSYEGQGWPGAVVPDHTENVDTNAGLITVHQAWNVVQAGTISEMKTGVDPNGDKPDIIITIDPAVANRWFNPHPFDSRDLDPDHSLSADMVSLILHELGHGFGIVTNRDPDTGALPSQVSPGLISYSETTFDKLVELHSDGSAWFTGANAEKVFGGPVPMTTLKNGEQYEHFGNDYNKADGSHDLMGGLGLDRGRPYEISALDLAVMQDIGAPVKVPVPQISVDPASLIGQHDPAIDAIHHLFG